MIGRDLEPNFQDGDSFRRPRVQLRLSTGADGSAGYYGPVPEPIDPRDMFSSHRPKIAGAAVQVSRSYGDTPGRYTVAEIIARIFPGYKSFVATVIQNFDLPLNEFPSGPYPTDTIRYQGETVAEYRTPPRAEGLGTYLWLGKSDRPIDGAALLVGPTPDLLLLAVRLSEKLESSTPMIVARFEHDGASQIL